MTTLDIRMGPALKYDTCQDGVYHAFALIVTRDSQSDYSVTPKLRLRRQSGGQSTVANGVLGNETTNGAAAEAVLPDSAEISSEAIQLHRYEAAYEKDSYTVWRFKIEIPMTDSEQKVTYSLDGRAHPDSQPPTVKDANAHSFFVPSKTQDFRWVGHSCNGFSASIDTKAWNGPNPLWDDVMKEHQKKPFHAVVGGGDQIYNDKLTSEPEMQPWTTCKDPKERMAMPLTDEIATCIDRYLFNHYCDWFGTGTFAKTIASIPMMNMLDDHDLIDGFGTYPDELMMAPIFNAIGSKGYFWYLIFQQFMKLEVDGVQDGKAHSNRSVIIGEQGAYVQYPNQSFLAYMGPKQWLLMIDCRAERKVDQICTKQSYEKIWSRVRSDLPPGVEHLVILLGVPLAYPRMVFLEKALTSSFNPLILLAKGISPGFTNDFNGQVELLDDLNDHWCAQGHKRERNALVCQIQEVALAKHLRVSFISGDVHAGGFSMFHGYHAHDPALDPKMMLAVITSAIVNAPPPPPVISMLNKLAKKKHRSLYYAGIKEASIPVFETDLEDKPQNDKYIIGARNWCAVTYLPDSGELEFQLRVEKSKGSGATAVKAYPVKAPPPRWDIPEKYHRHLLKKDFGKLLGAEGKAMRDGRKEHKNSDDPVLKYAANS